MSMLVRKGTMLHRNSPSRRSTGRRSSRGSIGSNRHKGDGNGSSGPERDRNLSDHSTTNSSSPSARRNAEARKESLNTNSGPNGKITNSGSSSSQLPEGSPSVGKDRRASSYASEISGDDRRQLFRYTKFAYESRDYGSIMSQIRDANTESNTGWEFTNKFFKILCKSTFALAFFVILTILPLSMAFMGFKYLEDCPLEPNLSLYLLIGGFGGLAELIWVIYSQVQSRKYEHCDSSFFEEDILLSSGTVKVMQWIAFGLLVLWFALGNSWIYGLSTSGPNGHPPFVPSLQAPNVFCSEQLYLYTIGHLYVIYSLVSFFALFYTACLCISTIRRLYEQNK